MQDINILLNIVLALGAVAGGDDASEVVQPEFEAGQEFTRYSDDCHHTAYGRSP